jgi:hypothetical protein
LLALGLRSHTDIPALKELEEWFDSQKEIRVIAKLDPFFERTSKLASRRLKREIERRGTLGEFALEPEAQYLERIPPEESAALIFSGVIGPMLLGGMAKSSRRRALCRAARLKGAPLGPGKKGVLIGSIGVICGRAAAGPAWPGAFSRHAKSTRRGNTRDATIRPNSALLFDRKRVHSLRRWGLKRPSRSYRSFASVAPRTRPAEL